MNRGSSVIAFIRAGANDRWNLNLFLKNDRAGLQAGLGFHDPYLLSPDFTSVRRRAGRPQPELLLLVAPSLPASKAGLHIGSRFHGCVSFRLSYLATVSLCPAFTNTGVRNRNNQSRTAQKSSGKCVDSLPILGHLDAAGLDVGLGFHGPCPPFFSDRRDTSFAFTNTGVRNRNNQSRPAQKKFRPEWPLQGAPFQPRSGTDWVR